MILSIDVTFTAGNYHGSEWPPAPTRLFQALVAASHRGAHGLIHAEVRDRALEWLEELAAPQIAASAGRAQREHLIHYVPNNDDGETSDLLNHVRAAKSLRVYPLPANCVVTYRWSFEPVEDARKHADVVAAMASLVTQLGRTVDLVYARGEVLDEQSEKNDDTREILEPREIEGGAWLSPKAGFLALCKRRYPRSVSEEPPDLTNSRQVNYGEPSIERGEVPQALFELRRPEGGLLPFDARQLREPSGMTRHAFQLWLNHTPRMEKHYGSERIARVLFGHRQSGNAAPSQGGHIAVVPLPSMNAGFTADGRMRRVLLLGHGLHDEGDKSLFADLTRGLDGMTLEDERTDKLSNDSEQEPAPQTRGYLRRVPTREADQALVHWKGIDDSGARVWRTVTPIILTGHMREGRTPEKCLARALSQQGIAPEAIESVATFSGPIVPKAVTAREYRVRGYLSNTRRLHAEIIFRKPTSGPLVVGRGRFAGFGLMIPWATESSLR